MKVSHLIALVIATVVHTAAAAQAADVCGNGADDDADGEADEGCYPGLTTVCESPLSCEETGFVSPSTGSLRYSLPPDIAPRVPWGPSIGIRRFYTSQSNPASTPQRKPMGDRWNHTYMSWVDTISSTVRVLHTSRGQDVVLTKTSSDATWDYYTPQAGHHFAHVRRKIASPNQLEVKQLTGEVAVYDLNGLLAEVRDTLATPNAVKIAYATGNVVDTVSDAANLRRLKFNYTSSLLTSIDYQLKISSVWTTQHTTTYGYTSGALTSVTIGGQLAQTNMYSGGYLTQIQDGGGKQIVAFAYSSTVAGRVHRVDSQRGMIGFDYNSSRTNCSAKTALYFNRGSTTSCTTDSDCGTGFLCGGNTAAGATGVCFRGARCLTIQNAAEDLVTTVTAFGPPSQTCDGACLDVAEYLWDTTGTKLDLVATKDPLNYYEARKFDANGLATVISYGDPDASPTSKGERIVFMEYGNATFPGKVTKVRRESDLDASASSCTEANTTGCASTTYTYSADGKLATRVDQGTTYTNTATTPTYTYTTTFTHDTLGRLTQIDHAKTGSNDLEVFDYWSSSDPLLDGFLRYYKRKKGAGYLTQEAKTYDFRGNATTLVDLDGTLSCQTFNPARGYLSERREAMAGQTTCSANAADLVTTYVRDSYLRLTQVTKRHDTSDMCMFYEYDAKGRLSVTKRRDDCNAGSAGERQEFTYDTEGLVVKTELFDAAGTVTKRQEWTYADSRRLTTIINPVNTAKWTGLTYDVRGLVTEIAAPDSLGKTSYGINPDGRVTTVDRYRTTTAFDRWNFLFAWLGSERKVTEDPTGTPKSIERKRDDMGRVVYVASPDIDYPSVKLYDPVGNLITNKELHGYSTPNSHQFTYDDLDRPLNDDYWSGCSGAGAEIQRVYDAPPVTCPAAGTGACAKTAGRLAYVKVSLLCSGSYGDGSLDQETFYGYDDAGRVIREYIRDDSGRVADQAYEWTKAGALSKVTLPSTASIWFNHGSAGSNSDTDRVASVSRNTSTNTLVAAATYYPYGPLRQYNHFNTIGGTALRTRITRNLAYRVSQVMMETQTGTQQQSVTITEDTKGRVTARDYFPNTNGVQDSYFIYDGLDRILCETTTSVGTCPSSGSNIKNSHTASTPFTPGGDWKQLMRPIPGSTGIQHDFNPPGFGPGGYPTNHRVTTVRQNTGSPAYGDTGFGYDAFGRRWADDNATTLTNDERTYSYSARGLVTNVHGKFNSSGWHSYDLTSAYDANGRRVYKSFYDNTTGDSSQWFFYYDPAGRLSEVRHTPNASMAYIYDIYQLVWLNDRFVGYYATAYPGAFLTRRYVGTDETGRPIDLWSNPGSGNAAQVWAVNPNAYGGEEPVLGSALFQPFGVGMACRDSETRALTNAGLVHRPGLLMGDGHYDPFIASYLQATATEAPYSPGDVERDNEFGCEHSPTGIGCGGGVILNSDEAGGGGYATCDRYVTNGVSTWCEAGPLDGWFYTPWPIGPLNPHGFPCADGDPRCGWGLEPPLSRCMATESPQMMECRNAVKWCVDNAPRYCPAERPNCIDEAQCFDGLVSRGEPCEHTAAGMPCAPANIAGPPWCDEHPMCKHNPMYCYQNCYPFSNAP